MMKQWQDVTTSNHCRFFFNYFSEYDRKRFKMGCIQPKPAKRKREERRRNKLPPVKQFLSKKQKNDEKKVEQPPTNTTGSVDEDERFTLSPKGNSVKRTTSNTTYVIETSSNPGSSRSQDLSATDSELCKSCTIPDLDSADEIEKNDIILERKEVIGSYDDFNKEVREQKELATLNLTDTANSFDTRDLKKRPMAAKGCRTNPTVSKSFAQDFLLPGCVDGFDENDDKELYEHAVSDIRNTRNPLVRPKAAKGPRTNPMGSKLTSQVFSLPGCVEELEQDVDKLMGGNNPASFVTNTRNPSMRPRAAVGQRTAHTINNESERQYSLSSIERPEPRREQRNRNVTRPQLTVTGITTEQDGFLDKWMERYRK